MTNLDYKSEPESIEKLLQSLGFKLKDGYTKIYLKKYISHDNYSIELDFEKGSINYGTKIKCEDRTTSNFKTNENFVVLECVNRLLEIGYKPQNIILEKVYPTGHGTSGKLDILITKGSQTFLMIECKTWGLEYDKELNKVNKNGGQLFTYFQQDRIAEYLVLYTSNFDSKNNEIFYKNHIIKIESYYREASNVEDLFDRWNKLFKDNGIFEEDSTPYDIKSKALTRKNLKKIKEEDSSFIFNRFLEILRHNVVSDKPNAFNKIFTLFLCKIVDEDERKDENDELDFQWLDTDNHIKFQKRLADLYKQGMSELLEKEITDISDEKFDEQFKNKIDEKVKEQIKDILTEIRLKKNNEFAIKEVYDEDSFLDNAKVVKEVVELLQGFRFRYNEKQQYLGDFFELLLTTGLKQEAAQFFTPIPVARFIIDSIPLKEITEKKLIEGKTNNLLPFLIDFACGSGHFLTESMDVLQNIINSIDESKLNSKRQIQSWKLKPFDWAFQYIYGIEKDYRLVKTAKVSCYLHGDGLAKVIHADGIGNFETEKGYKDKLKIISKEEKQDNKQFDVVVSNPPYSISAFKNTLEKENKSFQLFNRLTDQSSEIECLFIERTKQLLKDGGYAGIILPSSILSNTGIYEISREIILKYFKIVAITEFGSNTFMATGTNTITLFLERRNNYEWESIKSIVDKFFINFQDVACNGIDKPFSKYVNQAFDGVKLEDYITILKKSPNRKIQDNELYKDFKKQFEKFKGEDFFNKIIEVEKEKLLYFVLAYPQEVLLIKTIPTEANDKNKEEKEFLGYEFSFRRGHEGIKLYKDKNGNFLSKLYDPENNLNPNKANYYIYNQFLGNTGLKIPLELSKNIGYVNLAELMKFDRVDFSKSISTTFVKKNLK